MVTRSLSASSESATSEVEIGDESKSVKRRLSFDDTSEFSVLCDSSDDTNKSSGAKKARRQRKTDPGVSKPKTRSTSQRKVEETQKAEVKGLTKQFHNLKVSVFDHLFRELQSSFADTDLTIAQAADILFGLQADNLKDMLEKKNQTQRDLERKGQTQENSSQMQTQRETAAEVKPQISKAASALLPFKRKNTAFPQRRRTFSDSCVKSSGRGRWSTSSDLGPLYISTEESNAAETLMSIRASASPLGVVGTSSATACSNVTVSTSSPVLARSVHQAAATQPGKIAQEGCQLVGGSTVLARGSTARSFHQAVVSQSGTIAQGGLGGVSDSSRGTALVVDMSKISHEQHPKPREMHDTSAQDLATTAASTLLQSLSEYAERMASSQQEQQREKNETLKGQLTHTRRSPRSSVSGLASGYQAEAGISTGMSKPNHPSSILTLSALNSSDPSTTSGDGVCAHAASGFETMQATSRDTGGTVYHEHVPSPRPLLSLGAYTTQDYVGTHQVPSPGFHGPKPSSSPVSVIVNAASHSQEQVSPRQGTQGHRVSSVEKQAMKPCNTNFLPGMQNYTSASITSAMNSFLDAQDVSQGRGSFSSSMQHYSLHGIQQVVSSIANNFGGANFGPGIMPLQLFPQQQPPLIGQLTPPSTSSKEGGAEMMMPVSQGYGPQFTALKPTSNQPKISPKQMPCSFVSILPKPLFSNQNVNSFQELSNEPPEDLKKVKTASKSKSTPVKGMDTVTITTAPREAQPFPLTGSKAKSPECNISAKEAVKKLVSDRRKAVDNIKQEPNTGILKVADENVMKNVETEEAREEGKDNKHSKNNLEAASVLLSIGIPETDQVTTKSEPAKSSSPAVFTAETGIFKVDDVEIDPQINKIGSEGYSCGRCSKIFTSLAYLARHIKRVCPDMSHRKWKCSKCDKAFRHPFGLQQHVYTHTGERPHKCSQCPKAFYSSNDLRRHSRIHSGERPYSCEHCHKSFATTISLKTHTYIHTGEKPHKCPHCPKTFATSSKLGRHVVTHSEQRPFSCLHCPKTFNRSGDLRRHNMHIHEIPDKLFECKDCKKTFTSSVCLNMHKNKHKPASSTEKTDKVYGCETCSRKFDTQQQLDKHAQAHLPTPTIGYDSKNFHPIAPRPRSKSESAI